MAPMLNDISLSQHCIERPATSPQSDGEDPDKKPLPKICKAMVLLEEACAQLADSDYDHFLARGRDHAVSPTPPNHVVPHNALSLGDDCCLASPNRGSEVNMAESSTPWVTTRLTQTKLLPMWQNLMHDRRVLESYSGLMAATGQDFTHRTSFQRLPSMTGSRALDSVQLRWTIHPQSKQRILWDVLSVILITVDLFLVPMHTFDLTSIAAVLYLSDWSVAVFWTLDIVMSFRTGYYKKQAIELNIRKIAKRYVKTWMVVDVSIVVFEWVALMSKAASGANAARVQRLRVFARYIRGTRSAKLFTFTNKFKASVRSFYILLTFSLFKVSMGLMVVCHYLACGWYAIGRSSSDGWVYKESVTGSSSYSLIYLYMSSARWTLAQINGRTDQAEDRNMQERGYTCFCAFFTVVFYSLFISAITTRMVELLGARTEMQKGIRMLNAFAHRHPLKRQTLYFARKHVINHQAMENEQDTEAALLKLLPEQLKWDLVCEVRSPILIHHPLMKDLHNNFESAFRHMLATTMSNVYTRVHEVVFEPNIPCKRVLFHTAGHLHYNKQGNCGADLERVMQKENAHEPTARLVRAATIVWHRPKTQEDLEFGEEVPPMGCLSEAALWIEWKHKGALVSLAESHLLALDVDQFGICLCQHVDAQARAAIYAFEFHSKIQQREVFDLMEESFGALSFNFDSEDCDDGVASSRSLADFLFRGEKSQGEGLVFADSSKEMVSKSEKTHVEPETQSQKSVSIIHLETEIADEGDSRQSSDTIRDIHEAIAGRRTKLASPSIRAI